MVLRAKYVLDHVYVSIELLTLILLQKVGVEEIDWLLGELVNP